jgi:hypothetical protein
MTFATSNPSSYVTVPSLPGPSPGEGWLHRSHLSTTRTVLTPGQCSWISSGIQKKNANFWSTKGCERDGISLCARGERCEWKRRRKGRTISRESPESTEKHTMTTWRRTKRKGGQSAHQLCCSATGDPGGGTRDEGRACVKETVDMSMMRKRTGDGPVFVRSADGAHCENKTSRYCQCRLQVNEREGDPL